MSAWVILYVVGATCHMITMRAASAFEDAATVEDKMRDVLRCQGVAPELLVVYGPYGRILQDGIAYEWWDEVHGN